MNTAELFHHAQLDALGLLEESEREAFETALAHAPAALREQIAREQARWCRMDHLLPNVSASPELRERVLEAVSDEQALHRSARLLRHEGGVHGARPRRVAPAWRAASFALMTACVVLASAFAHTVYKNAELAARDTHDQELAAVGHAFGAGALSDALFHPATQRVLFRPTLESSGARASLWTNPSWSSARLFSQSLTCGPDETLRLVVLDNQGNVQRELGEFTSSGGLTIQDIAISDAPTQRLAIVAAQRGQSAAAGSIVMRIA